MPMEGLRNKKPTNIHDTTTPGSLAGQNQYTINRISENIEGLSRGEVDGFTILDFQWINSSTTDDGFLNWVERETGVAKYLLNLSKCDIENNPEAKKRYQELDIAYQSAKKFLKDTLGYEDGEIKVKDPGSIKSKEDLLKLLKNIKLVKGDTVGLGQALKYCRLVKTTLAFFEARKHKAMELEKITKELEDLLLSSRGDGGPMIKIRNDKDGFSVFLSEGDDGSTLEGLLDSRAKEIEGVVLRFINRPESNAETAFADGVGIKIYIKKEQAIKLASVLCEWLVSKMGVGVLKIENQSLLTENEKTRLKNGLRKVGEKIKTVDPDFSPEDAFHLLDDEPNDTSAGDIRVLKIKGKLNVARAEDEKENEESAIVHAGQFEILLVPEDTTENEGENNHHLYDAKKFIFARTRLDGYCSKEAFDTFVGDAFSRSGISTSDILYYFLGKITINKKTRKKTFPPIVEVKRKNGQPIYLAYSVYERWKHLGHISNQRFLEVEEARMESQRKYARE